MSKLVNRYNQLGWLFERAEKNWDNGKFRVAFRLYVKAATRWLSSTSVGYTPVETAAFR